MLQGAAAAHGRNIPFLPILQILRQYFGIGEREGERAARERIAGRLLLIDEGLREFLPVVFDFMGCPTRTVRLEASIRMRGSGSSST